MGQPVSKRLQEYKARSHLRESSEENLDRAIEWFVDLHGDMEASTVRFGHVDDFRSWLLKPRRRVIPHTNRRGKPYQPGPASANAYLAIIKPFFGWLVKRGYLDQDPFDGVKLYKTTPPKNRTFTVDEIGRILQVADRRFQTIVCLALCSMRAGEIMNLVVSDIDFSENLILVNPKRQTDQTWKWEIKDYERQYIGFDESIASLLTRLIADLDGGQPYVVLKPDYWKRNLERQEKGELTSRLRNCPWGNFNRDWKALLRRARVDPNKFHNLRGTFATQRHNEGYGLKQIQILLRHSSIQTTARYIETIEEKKLIKQSSRTFKKYYASLVP